MILTTYLCWEMKVLTPKAIRRWTVIWTNYESFYEETQEYGERIAEELDQDDNYEINPTDNNQQTSKEDDCIV